MTATEIYELIEPVLAAALAVGSLLSFVLGVALARLLGAR